MRCAGASLPPEYEVPFDLMNKADMDKSHDIEEGRDETCGQRLADEKGHEIEDHYEKQGAGASMPPKDGTLLDNTDKLDVDERREAAEIIPWPGDKKEEEKLEKEKLEARRIDARRMIKRGRSRT